MRKGYWVAVYLKINDPDALAKYSSVAAPILQGLGGRILARGNAARGYEAGSNERLVLIEFDSVAKAIAAYESPEYQATLPLLKNAVERDIRIIEGL